MMLEDVKIALRNDPVASGGRLLPIFLFIVSLLLSYPLLTPAIYQINPWDESLSINSGRLLLAGTLPNFAANPLVSLLYALILFPSKFIAVVVYSDESDCPAHSFLLNLVRFLCHRPLSSTMDPPECLS